MTFSQDNSAPYYTTKNLTPYLTSTRHAKAAVPLFTGNKDRT